MVKLVKPLKHEHAYNSTELAISIVLLYIFLLFLL